MEKQLLDMMQAACGKEVAVSQRLAGKMELLVYPLRGRPGVMVGVGYGADAAHLVNMDELLQRRTQDIARFGAWLPAVFADGSSFLVMRIDQPEPDEHLASRLANEIHTAKELLS